MELAALCQNKQHWESAIESSHSEQQKPQLDDDLTSSQRRWLHDIAACTPPNCFQAQSSRERQKRQLWAPKLAVRKEYRTLTDEERNRFHAALRRLKEEQLDGRSKYDLFGHLHSPLQAPGAHWGPAFLPWHRELLRQFELALRQIDEDVSLPFWDSTLDQGLPHPPHSLLWTASFMGNSSDLKPDYVLDGPFANWTTRRSKLPEPRIVRNLGRWES